MSEPHSSPTPSSPTHPKLDELIAVLARLRAPGGCAWDREQTHESLVQYLIEETYELVDAIEGDSDSPTRRTDLIEELGDVLYQVIFHSDLAAEAGQFTIEDVASHMTAKMIGRHPHVFGDATADTSDAVVALWEVRKAEEKPHRTSVLDGIPQGMPSLALADKLLGRALRAGLVGAHAAGSVPALLAVHLQDEEQLGAMLLGIVSSAKAGGMDAERALRSSLRELQREIREAEAEHR
ncbi:MazG family protein [Frigoribacterium sp. CG_9.8]|uniref:MazG family protein n=1 Tax=Frigoribacterium sp. CG_9.8 TaxID=2787733 RepID=UPI0018CA91B3|nr:MazG family protein [Frigoribacterium sp. CG_9.8]MBG6109098.1 XTP/dITP diphosphohydrolase [Frigoribacterium sp. CG_9.8]